MSTPPTVLVTGASGLLGRAVCAAFASAGWRVVAATHSRSLPDAVACDLRSPSACAALVSSTSPSCIVHTAAERRPDVCERDPAATEALNVHAPYHLGLAAAQCGAALIHISTDYLWAGNNAPYDENAPTAPPNSYGRQKRRAEHAALASSDAALVLRVPVLYGPTSDLSESAVTAFATTVLAAATPATVDDWQIRVPTYTPDVAQTCLRLAEAARGAGVPGGIYNYSSSERFTRWGLVQAFAEMLAAPILHVTRLEGAPPGAKRPYDCQLNTNKLQALGLAAPCTPFQEGAREVLKGAGAKVVG